MSTLKIGMSFPSRLCWLLLCLFALVAALPSAEAQIHADVTVSGGVNGTFTITLEHEKTPLTVANFIGLATGSRGWLDVATGAIRKDPFYSGVIFHRVIAGFMSQTGSRTGDGTDGPGYSFPDEFHSTLRHDSAYVVSMANSGKQTNGSQIFITAAATSHLDNLHSVFGRVTAGQSVCDQINRTSTGANDRPVTPIVIQSIQVYGPSLASFPVATAPLPRIVNARPIPKRIGASFLLNYDRLPFSTYTGYNSPNLAAWSRFISTYSGATGPASDLNVSSTATGRQQFYRLARIDYSPSALADRAGNTFTFSNPLGGTAALNATKTAGTWTFSDDGSTQTITSASFIPQPYSAGLTLQLSNGMRFTLTLTYTSRNAGTYTGTTNVTGFGNVSGTFTIPSAVTTQQAPKRLRVRRR